MPVINLNIYVFFDLYIKIRLFDLYIKIHLFDLYIKN